MRQGVISLRTSEPLAICKWRVLIGDCRLIRDTDKLPEIRPADGRIYVNIPAYSAQLPSLGRA